MTAKNQYEERSLRDSPSLVEILEAAGFDTYWVSAQYKFGTYDTPTSLIANQVDQEIWLNGMIYDNSRQNVYDGQLLQVFEEMPVMEGRKRVVFLHMNGCHADYRLRYPGDRTLWKVADRQKDRVNAYGNAMHYSDEVWGQLLSILEKRPDFRAVLMVSDHGEEPVVHGHTPDEKLFRWSMVRIPAWFAFSPEYTKAHPERIAAMQDNAWKPWTNDLFFDAVLGVLGVVDHPFYEERNDITSYEYDRPYETLRTLHGKRSLTEDPEGLRNQI